MTRISGHRFTMTTSERLSADAAARPIRKGAPPATTTADHSGGPSAGFVRSQPAAICLASRAHREPRGRRAPRFARTPLPAAPRRCPSRRRRRSRARGVRSPPSRPILRSRHGHWDATLGLSRDLPTTPPAHERSSGHCPTAPTPAPVVHRAAREAGDRHVARPVRSRTATHPICARRTARLSRWSGRRWQAIEGRRRPRCVASPTPRRRQSHPQAPVASPPRPNRSALAVPSRHRLSGSGLRQAAQQQPLGDEIADEDAPFGDSLGAR